MKFVSNVIGCVIIVLVLYNILRFLLSITESYFNLSLGIDFLLYNNYMVYGAMGLLVVLAFIQEIIDHRYHNNEHLY